MSESIHHDHGYDEAMKRLGPGSPFAARFTIRSLIGTGAMGAVYEADDRETGEPCALKLLHSDLIDADPRALHRFEREARLGAELDCPYIVRVHATGIDDATATPWIAMERLHGRSLGALLKEQTLLERTQGLRLLHELFAAVGAAHAAGVVHRDLKPENAFVLEPAPEAGPLLKVLDFGVAKRHAGSSVSATAGGFGTPLWAPPELGLDDWVPAPSADVWALGLITFRVLVGRVYWKSASLGSMASLAMELVRGPIDPPSQRAVELGAGELLPEGFDAWFLRCVARSPTARFADAQLAWHALPETLKDA